MTESDTPTAFEAHFLGCKESKITSSSIVDRGSRIYLGLEGGVLEECSVKTVEGNDVCSTVACKPLFTQVSCGNSLSYLFILIRSRTLF